MQIQAVEEVPLEGRGISKALRPRKEIGISLEYKEDLEWSEVERDLGSGRGGQG